MRKLSVRNVQKQTKKCNRKRKFISTFRKGDRKIRDTTTFNSKQKLEVLVEHHMHVADKVWFSRYVKRTVGYSKRKYEFDVILDLLSTLHRINMNMPTIEPPVKEAMLLRRKRILTGIT